MFASRGSRPDRVKITRQGRFLADLIRTVNRGLSWRIVSAPTRMASTVARSSRASRRDWAEVIHCESVGGAVSRPSRLIPHFAITNGSRVLIHLLNASFNAVHSDS